EFSSDVAGGGPSPAPRAANPADARYSERSAESGLAPAGSRDESPAAKHQSTLDARTGWRGHRLDRCGGIRLLAATDGGQAGGGQPALRDQALALRSGALGLPGHAGLVAGPAPTAAEIALEGQPAPYPSPTPAHSPTPSPSVRPSPSPTIN